jgi:hypothetical protein
MRRCPAELGPHSHKAGIVLGLLQVVLRPVCLPTWAHRQVTRRYENKELAGVIYVLDCLGFTCNGWNEITKKVGCALCSAHGGSSASKCARLMHSDSKFRTEDTSSQEKSCAIVLDAIHVRLP